jgi:metal-dependent amidase/aminoacylase/carboxypeptidase family protein
LEIRVDVSGISCHCSAPERGDNAIYKIEDIFQDVSSLNKYVSNSEIKGQVKI